MTAGNIERHLDIQLLNVHNSRCCFKNQSSSREGPYIWKEVVDHYWKSDSRNVSEVSIRKLRKPILLGDLWGDYILEIGVNVETIEKEDSLSWMVLFNSDFLYLINERAAAEIQWTREHAARLCALQTSVDKTI